MSNTGMAFACVIAAILAAMATVFACSVGGGDDDDCAGAGCDDDAVDDDDWDSNELCLTNEDCEPLVTAFSDQCPTIATYDEIYQAVCVDNSNVNCLADCWEAYTECTATWNCYTSNECGGSDWSDDDCK